MITSTYTYSPSAQRPETPVTLLQQAWQFNRILTITMVFHAVLIAVGVFGLALDSRVILNAPLWAKTTKFAISITLYCGTLIWMLMQLKSRPRLAHFVATGTGIIMLVEIAVILIQNILRRVPAHYNTAGLLDVSLWSTMGTAIMAAWGISALAAIALLFEKIPNRVLGVAIRLGLFVSLIGMALAFMMTSPNVTQTAALESGQTLTMIGAHNVNALVDGQTRMIPFLGWNMDGGDLRIAHFIGLHGMQVIPLIGLLALRLVQLSERRRIAMVWLVATGYLGLMLLTLWQALRNQSIIAPDGLTLIVLANLIMVVVIGFALIMHNRRPVAVSA